MKYNEFEWWGVKNKDGAIQVFHVYYDYSFLRLMAETNKNIVKIYDKFTASSYEDALSILSNDSK